MCLVYPNSYGVGMANLGFQMAYHLFNEEEGSLCERAFLPDKKDFDEFLRTSTQLFSLESTRALREFDIVAFSISFEEDYLNIPKILALSGIPVFSRERGTGDPVVLAGGIAPTINPEPLAEIADLFLIGEAEGAVGEFIECYEGLKGLERGSRHEFIKGFDSMESVYVPSLYGFDYDGARLASIRPLEGAKTRVRARRSLDLKGFELPENFVYTPDTAFRDTTLVEIERGCGRGCRFCAAGFICLPPRQRDMGAVKEAVRRGVESTGKVGLVGTAVSEYPWIKEVLEEGISQGAELTLSSLRLDVLDSELMGLLKRSGYKTVTLAPEAGSERLRRVVNKGITDSEILDAVRLITDAGFTRIKLYFLIGLPTETDTEALAVSELSSRVRSEMKSGVLTLSINPFIPKPSTPFQWHRFEDMGVLEKRLSAIKEALKGEKGVSIKAMPVKEAFFQAYISRADRRVASFIKRASEAGLRRAAREEARGMEEAVYRERKRDEPLPWDIIDQGLRKDYLWREYQRGLKGELTDPCRVGTCFRCGVCIPGGTFL